MLPKLWSYGLYKAVGNLLLVIFAFGRSQDQNCVVKINNTHMNVYSFDGKNKTSFLSLSQLISGTLVEDKCNVYLEETQSSVKFRLLKLLLTQSHHKKDLPPDKANQDFIDRLFKVYKKALSSNCVYIVSDEQQQNRKLASLLTQKFTKHNLPTTQCIKTVAGTMYDLLKIQLGIDLSSIREIGENEIIFIFACHLVSKAIITTLHERITNRNKYSLIWVIPFDKGIRINDLPRGVIAYQKHQTVTFDPITIGKKSNQTRINIKKDCLRSKIKLFIMLTCGWEEVYTNAISHSGKVIESTDTFTDPNLIGIITMPQGIKIVSILSSTSLFERRDSYVDKRCIIKDTIPCLIPSVPDTSNVLNSTVQPTIWRKSCCAGYTADLIQLLERKLFFKASLYIVEDRKYGSVYSNGTGVGMIGDVYHGKAAMAIAQLTINSQRQKYVDFSIPFFQDSLGIVKRKPTFDNGTLFNFELIIPFHLNFILSMFGLVFGSAILIYFAEQFIFYHFNHYDSLKRDTKQNKSTFSFMSCLHFICGIFFGRHVTNEVPKTASSLVFVCFGAFALMTLSTMYTASLTADLVVVENDFTGFHDPKIQNPSNQFKFTIQRDTSVEQYFKFSESEKVRRIYYFMKQYLTKRSRHAITNILNRELDGYIDEFAYLKRISQKHCELEVYPMSRVPSAHGIALAKNSTLSNIISSALMDLLEAGEIATLETKWRKGVECPNNLQSRRFSLRLFAAPFLLLGAGMLTSVIIFLLQCFIQRVRRISCT